MADDLNRDIAECLGWQHNWIVDQDQDDVIVWENSRTGQVVAYLPEYTTDPAACLELLTYVCTLRLDDRYPLCVRELGQYEQADQWRVQIGAMQQKQIAFEDRDEPVWIPAGEDWGGEGGRLETAIARACLAAIQAVREGQTP